MPTGVMNLVSLLAFVPFMLCKGLWVRLARHEKKKRRMKSRFEVTVEDIPITRMTR